MIGQQSIHAAHHLRLSTLVRFSITLALVATALLLPREDAQAWFDKKCERRPAACERAESWANIKRHQFKSRNMPRTPDRRIRPLREYYKHAWLKKYGPAVAQQTRHDPENGAVAVDTPHGLCSGWRDCFGTFVDAANCAAHPVVTAVCLRTSVLDDGIGKPEKAELICAGTVLITGGGNPVAVGRGAIGCYWVWLGWQIFG